ncbi:MAG TPA: UpxY family transcription antiterminator [Terriglobia bacterium]|nr:UpxY family transcription antiterminator [Terriglobia bacterium]
MQALESTAGERETKSDAAWYALYTRHQHEKVVAQALSGKGFEVFLPLYSIARRWQDRVKQLALPLFPSYVFLRTGLDRRLPVVTTAGVHHFVPTDDRPIPISEGEIDSVRQLTLKSTRVEPHPFLKRGDWVRVKTGPLEGLEGILTRWKAAFRLVLSVELVQQSVAVEVEASNVEPIREPRNRQASGYLR